MLCESTGARIVSADYAAEQLSGGTVGDVRLVKGSAVDAHGVAHAFKLVVKSQHKWERQSDAGSWRREYDLYISGLGELLTGALRWPRLYRSAMGDGSYQLWMEHIDGVSGLDLTTDMCVRAARELGRFQGRLYAEQPDCLNRIGNLSRTDAMKNYYAYSVTQSDAYDYIRSEGCELPAHLRAMIIDMEKRADAVWDAAARLPVVLCHRDFWVANIFHTDACIVLIDWDTTGWGYLGEDITSLIADEADPNRMLDWYRQCVPAYADGFGEYADSGMDMLIYERIVLHYGYRIAEWFLYAGEQQKKLQLDTLQRIYEMGDTKIL